MGRLADVALHNGANVVGVIPHFMVNAGIAHCSLSDIRIVRDMHERKASMTTLSDAFMGSPGGTGTLEEFVEALTLSALNLHSKPCVLTDTLGSYSKLHSFLDHAAREGFLTQEILSLFITVPPHMAHWNAVLTSSHGISINGKHLEKNEQSR